VVVASAEDGVVDVSLEAAEVEGTAVGSGVEVWQATGIVSVGVVETERPVAIAIQDKESEAPHMVSVRHVVVDHRVVGAASESPLLLISCHTLTIAFLGTR
jgi:hypothetical protein